MNGKNKTTDERKKKIINLYKKGKDQKTIAAELSTSRNTTRAALREAGLIQ